MTETIVSIRSAARRTLPSGTVLNDTFVVDDYIATGGMGEVYRGRMITTGASVAIKLIKQEFLEDEGVNALFLREASALDSLAHDAIVRYYICAIDRTLNRPYLAMEFVEGPQLSTILGQRRLSFEEVDELRKRLAQGLQAAHDRNIVHRDIAPDNVILPGGDLHKAKLIDFGIAKSNNLSVKSVIQDGFAGKYNYASPEQFGLFKKKPTERVPGSGDTESGGSSNVGPASDIYSLGLVIAECLLGRPIDMGSDFADAVDKRRAMPELAGVDARLRPLLEQMLQPKPDDRIRSMTEVAAWTVSEVRTPRSSGRKLFPIIGGALGVMGLAAAGAILLFRPPDPKPVAPKELTNADFAARIANYVRYYDGNDCLLLRPLDITGEAASIEAISASAQAVQEFTSDFRSVNGFAPQMLAHAITQRQCDLVTLAHRLDPAAGSGLNASLSKPVYRAAENVAMTVSGAGKNHVELLALGEDGMVQNLTHLLSRQGENLVLNAPVSAPGGKPSQKLLVSIVTPERLDVGAAFARGTVTSAIFSSIAAEIERKKTPVQIVPAYVRFE